MRRYQSFRYALQPTTEQEIKLVRLAGCCRYVYNRALALQMAAQAIGAPVPDAVALMDSLTCWAAESATGWLQSVPMDVLRQSLLNLQQAQVNREKGHAREPRFKVKGRSMGIRYSRRHLPKINAESNRIKIVDLGWIRFINSRPIEGRPLNATITQGGGRWHISILTERDCKVQARCGEAVGVDLGIKRFATLSDGSFHMPLNSFRRHEVALAVAQRKLSRKTRFSSNWRKQKTRLERIHLRISNARQDYLHKITTGLSKTYATVCIEDLRVKSLSQATNESTGIGARVSSNKSSLNKSILDQGWYEFRQQLAYKMRWSGGSLVVVKPHYTSQRCPKCHWVSERNRPSREVFSCVQCHYTEHADRVGATNILRAGHARIACDSSRPKGH